MCDEVLKPLRKKYPGYKLLQHASEYKTVQEFALAMTTEFNVKLKNLQLLMLERELSFDLHERGKRTLLNSRNKKFFVVHDFSNGWPLRSDLREVAWGRFGLERKPWVLGEDSLDEKKYNEDLTDVPFGSLYNEFELLFVTGKNPIFRFCEEIYEPIHGRLYELIPRNTDHRENLLD